MSIWECCPELAARELEVITDYDPLCLIKSHRIFITKLQTLHISNKYLPSQAPCLVSSWGHRGILSLMFLCRSLSFCPFLLCPAGMLHNPPLVKESCLALKIPVFVKPLVRWGVGNTSNPEGHFCIHFSFLFSSIYAFLTFFLGWGGWGGLIVLITMLNQGF